MVLVVELCKIWETQGNSVITFLFLLVLKRDLRVCLLYCSRFLKEKRTICGCSFFLILHCCSVCRHSLFSFYQFVFLLFFFIIAYIVQYKSKSCSWQLPLTSASFRETMLLQYLQSSINTLLSTYDPVSIKTSTITISIVKAILSPKQNPIQYLQNKPRPLLTTLKYEATVTIE